MSISAQTHLPPPAAARIEFGWIKQAWALFLAQPGVWTRAMLLCFLLDAAAWVLLSIPTGVFATMRHSFASVAALQHPAVSAYPYQEFVQGQAFGILAGCPIAVFNGGFFQMALRQKQGLAISVSGLFAGFSKALPLVAIATVIPATLNLVEGAGLWALHFSMTPTASIAVINKITQFPGLLLPGLIMFAPLLVVDANANIADALLGSLHLLKNRWLMGIAFYGAVSLLSYAGVFLCGIGLLVTCPLFFLSITIAYLAVTQPDAAASSMPFDPAPVGVWPPPPRIPEEKR